MKPDIAGRLALLLALAFAATFAPGVNAASGDERFLYGRTLATGELAAVCFARGYDAAHLAGHPHQNVTAMQLFAYRPDWPAARSIVNLEIRFRGVDEPVRLSGECRPARGRVDRLDCGIECDGGAFGLRHGAGGALMVDVPDGLSLCDGDEDLPAGARFGADDRLFRLDPVPLPDCAGLVFDDEIRPRLDALR